MSASDLFDNKDPFGLPPLEDDPTVPGSNAPPEISVSELSQKLKRLVEGEFSFVRVRGEISRVTVARSGHMYTSLKDENAVLDAVCWKGTLSRLNIKPEEGLDVVCTGRLTTYPGRSNYQLVIETMELAGEGALLKMLEERKKKLAAEGLFDPARKRAIPFIPQRIGVVTSATGAVIRDILHRLSDRFPRHVVVWPVMVQGKGAAEQVAAGINGFNSLPEDSPYRPDLIIVARGGGSLEDLMPFNEEIVVRAAANSGIPLISAVGHETDTTLIDFAADLRAPTPTAAAEKAVPVRNDLLSQVMENDRRLFTAIQRLIQQNKIHIDGLARGLTDPKRLMEQAAQRLDHATLRLDGSLEKGLDRKASTLRELEAKLSPQTLKRRITDTLRILEGYGDRLNRSGTQLLETSFRTLENHEERLHRSGTQLLETKQTRLQNLSSLLESLSFERVLDRGFALVTDREGKPLLSAKDAKTAKKISLRFHDGSTQAETE